MIINGQASHYAFTALIEFCDPVTKQLQRHLVKSPDFGAGRKDQYSTSFKVGDYVTAVYLPHKYPKSLKLFGFLELVPGIGLVRSSAATKGKLWKTLLLAVVVVAFLAVALGNLYAASYYMPVSLPYGTTGAASSTDETAKQTRRLTVPALRLRPPGPTRQAKG